MILEDNIDRFENTNCLLKECYELASRYELQDDVKRILISKFSQLGCQQELSNEHLNSEMQIISSVMSKLEQNLNLSKVEILHLVGIVEKLANSGEKEYLLALLALRNGRNETQRVEALRHISLACKFAGDDPRYNALARILCELNEE